jgi:hypothetical protein
VGNFIFSVDFIIQNVKEDREISILIGMPFLTTRRALIDILKGELGLRMNKKEVTFNVLNTIKYPSIGESCFIIQTIDTLVINGFSQQNESLEACLVDLN